MGSRLRENVKHLFECFCEVAAPVGEQPAWILQKYPDTFTEQELIKNVPKFAYPCDFENSTVQHFSFVLTSIDSKWTFGFCRHDPKTETALVLLSSLPWHEMFYKLLNNIATLAASSNSASLNKFLDNVYASNVPMPGASVTIPLSDSTPNLTYVCQSPRQFQLPSIPENRNLTEYYSAVDAHNMMIIFASMLYERRIIFTSKKLSRLSACVQACNALIYPMIWQHIYIPVLPLALIDYLLAPMPFLIGLPSTILQRVQKNDLGDVVVLDADNNTIESPFQDLESLPNDVITNLRKALRNRASLLGDGVSRAFLRALVQLTAGYREALTLQQGERITFDQNAFVESRPYSMQPFLRKMLELQIFQQFIEERLHMLNSGLGFSDEFEMEACNYSDKSSSKFIQQYREWTGAMKKEGSAFFRSVKDKANPAMKNAVKSVKNRGKDMKTAYKGLKWKGRSRPGDNSIRFHQQPRSAPSSPTLERRSNIFGNGSKSQLSNGGDSASVVTATTSYRKELRLRNSTAPETSRKQYSPLSPGSPAEPDSPPERLTIDLMNELQDVIFPNTPPVDRTGSSSNIQDIQDLIRLDSTNSDDDFDPLLSKSFTVSQKQMSQSLNIHPPPPSSPQISDGNGLSNPLYPYFLPQPTLNTINNVNDKQTRDFDLLQEYGLDFNKFSLANNNNNNNCSSSSTTTTTTTTTKQISSGDTEPASAASIDHVFGPSTVKLQKNWTTFD